MVTNGTVRRAQHNSTERRAGKSFHWRETSSGWGSSAFTLWPFGCRIRSERRSPVKTVRDILTVKGRDVWTVDLGATVFEALSRMAEKEVGALMVMDGPKLVGVISERDYARKVILHGRASPTTLVKEIMTTHVVYTHLGQSIEECMALVTEKRIRHLPVIDEGNLVGVVSIGDLVKSIISDQKFVIEQLVRYITS